MSDSNSEIVAALVGDNSPNRGGWINVDCPFCESRVGKPDRKRRLGINASTGRYKCFRCDVWGYLRGDFEHATASVPTVDAWEKPSDYQPIGAASESHSMLLRDAFAFLKQRHVRVDTFTPAQIGVALCGADAGRVILPCVGSDGAWFGWVGRHWRNGATMPHKTAPGMQRNRFYNERAVDVVTDLPLLVVEGPLDALPYWPHAVACLGKPNADQLASLYRAQRPIAFCLDGDAWQESQSHAWRLSFDGRRAGFVRLPAGEDPNSLASNTAWLLEHAARCVAA